MGGGCASKYATPDNRVDVHAFVLFGPAVKRLSREFRKYGEVRTLFARYVMEKKWMSEFVERRKAIFTDAPNNPDCCDMGVQQTVEALVFLLPHSDLFVVPPPVEDKPEQRRLSFLTFRRKRNRIRNSLTLNTPVPRRLFPGVGGSSKKQESMRNIHNVQLFLCACLMGPFSMTSQYQEWKKSRGIGGSSSARNLRQMTSFFQSSMGMSCADDTHVATEHDKLEATVSTAPPSTCRTASSPMNSSSGNNRSHELSDSPPPPAMGSLSPSPSCLAVAPSTSEDHRFADFLHHLVTPIHETLLSQTLAQENWLHRVVNFLDELPFAISISSGHSSSGSGGGSMTPSPYACRKESFPLMYVNKAFETCTGYRSHEVLGRNCRFLQSEECTEMQQVEKMKQALRELQPIKVAVTNARKDGRSFLNFLSLLPVVPPPSHQSATGSAHHDDDAPRKCTAVVAASYDILQQQEKRFGLDLSLGGSNSSRRYKDQRQRRNSLECLSMGAVSEDLHCIDDLLTLLSVLMTDTP